MFDAVSHLELILKCDGAMQLFYPLHAYILTTRKHREHL